MRRAAQDRVLHETAMAAAAVLRGEERVSLWAAVLFLFWHTCAPSVVLGILIYKAPILTYCLLCDCLAHSLLLLASFLHSQKKKWLLYLLLGPLSFDKAS